MPLPRLAHSHVQDKALPLVTLCQHKTNDILTGPGDLAEGGVETGQSHSIAEIAVFIIGREG